MPAPNRSARAHRWPGRDSRRCAKPRRRRSPMATTPPQRRPSKPASPAIRALRAQLGSMGLSDSARYEIDFRLKWKERDYEDAVLAAHDVTFDALADDGLVIGGQPVQLTLTAMNHGATGSQRHRRRDRRLRRRRPTAPPGAAKKDATYTCSAAGARSERRQAHHALLQRQLLEASRKPGHPDLRPQRSVRRAVCALAVPRDVPCQSGQRRRHQGIAGRISLREGHLFRR